MIWCFSIFQPTCFGAYKFTYSIFFQNQFVVCQLERFVTKITASKPQKPPTPGRTEVLRFWCPATSAASPPIGGADPSPGTWQVGSSGPPFWPVRLQEKSPKPKVIRCGPFMATISSPTISSFLITNLSNASTSFPFREKRFSSPSVHSPHPAPRPTCHAEEL